MVPITEIGSQILNNTPLSLYMFCGTEYGVKNKYIEHLKSYYKQSQEHDSLLALMDFMSKKRLIPLQPTLYIIRYDTDFIQKLNETIAQKLSSLKVVGTIVCIYEDEKAFNKLDKFLPKCTTVFSKINKDFIQRYLAKDYPTLPECCIQNVLKYYDNYYQASIICNSLSYLADYPDLMFKASSENLHKYFGGNESNVSNALRYAFAARNIKMCFDIIDGYTASLDSVFYVFLSTLIDLENSINNKKRKSDLSSYVEGWDINSIVNMFNNVYGVLNKSRNSTYFNIYDSIIHLISLLAYEVIPSIE